MDDLFKENCLRKMGESYLWRLEIQPYQFIGVLEMLTGMGFLTEDTYDAVVDDFSDYLSEPTAPEQKKDNE